MVMGVGYGLKTDGFLRKVFEVVEGVGNTTKGVEDHAGLNHCCILVGSSPVADGDMTEGVKDHVGLDLHIWLNPRLCRTSPSCL